MTLADALDIVIARTGHQRFRFLCSEANPHADSREGYRALVLDLAAGKGPPAQRVELRTASAPILPRARCCGG